MTVESRNPLSRVPPLRMAIYLSLALIAVHLILLVGGFLRQNAAADIAEQLEALQSNVQDLNASEQAELERLVASRDQWQGRVDELRAQLPEPSRPFPVYEQSQAIAEPEVAALLRVERLESDTSLTTAGPIQTDVHRLTLTVGLEPCLEFISDLENAGGVRLALEEISFSAEAPTCSMSVNTVARTSEN